MTSRASHRPRSNGSSALARAASICLLVSLAVTTAAAEPVLTKTDDGVIDWTHRTVRAIGVGTPRILSPTGALTPRDLYDAARGDAEKRLARLVARLPVDERRRLRDLDALDERRVAMVKGHTAAETRHFADGSVHLPASSSFAWVAAEWPADDAPAKDAGPSTPRGGGAGEAPPIVGPPMPGPTGLVITLDGPLEPTVRLRLKTPAGQVLGAGTVLDRLGSDGAYYIRDRGDVEMVALVGDTPLTVEGSPGGARGAVALRDEALVGRHLPGAVVLVLPAEAE